MSSRHGSRSCASITAGLVYYAENEIKDDKVRIRFKSILETNILVI